MRTTLKSTDRSSRNRDGITRSRWVAFCLAGFMVVVVIVGGCAANRTGGEDGSADAATHEQGDPLAADRTAFFEQGIEYSEFATTVKRREAMWQRNSAKGDVPAAYIERVVKARGESPPLLHLLAVAEDGCSDSANIVPYLARFVDAIDGLDLRIINSKVGREIMTNHPTPDGRAATPTIVVLDSNFRELGCLIERPKELQDWALKSKGTLPDEEFMEQKFAWYDNDLGKQSMAEIVAVIEGVGGELINCGIAGK